MQNEIDHRVRVIAKFVLPAFLVLQISCIQKEDLGPSPVQAPADELESFEYTPDLRIELVASEPMIQDPVVISFDEDGRLWVVEMRGFMEDIDGTTEKERIGRISILEDKDADGTMDSSLVYIDSLIMPRALAIINGGALIAEDEKLWLTEDLNGDSRADSKILIDSTYAGSPLPEHSGNGLWRGIDNWYYNVKSQLRYKQEDGKWLRDSTEFRGQWGLSHDDEGRLIYNYNWSQLHADLVPPNYLSRNRHHNPTTGIDHGLTTNRRIYPIRPNLAVNRGYVEGTLDNQDRLLEFTAACSPFYYRGTALPKEYYGNVFVCEPSGNLVKRNIVREKGYYLSAFDPTPGKEFLASEDERFRPVSFASGPDGALYVVDMYRGLVQHGRYITEYLREKTLERKLDKPAHCGRIWRITSRDWQRSSVPRLSKASSAELVQNLSHPNGWMRDVSQRLLIDRNENSSLQLLHEGAFNDQNSLGRLHALWTLAGLKAVDSDFLFKLMEDSAVPVRTSAMRLIESMATQDNTIRVRLEDVLVAHLESAGEKGALQIALTSGVLKSQDKVALLLKIVDKYDSSALMRDALLSSIQDDELPFLQRLMTKQALTARRAGREILIEMLAAAIVKKREPSELLALISLLDKSKHDWKERAILNALVIQGTKIQTSIKLSAQPTLMARANSPIDSAQLAILSGMFEWPGHRPAHKPAASAKLSADELKQFSMGRQQYLTTCASCHGTDGAGLSRFAPTLVRSEWVVGDEKRLALIVLHGIEGPIDVNDKHFDAPEILPVMPAHTTLDDESITNILTYIRNAWGNSAGAVKRRTVGVTRNRAQGRVQPWTVRELENYLKNTKDQE